MMKACGRYLPENYAFSMTLEVRDYECDIEGIVNNANYLHYLEHTRHAFCQKAGISFGRMHEQGLDPVLRRAELDYMCPLRPDDHFISALNIERRGAKFVFLQDLFRKRDGNQVLHAEITIVCLEDGRLSRGDKLAAYFTQYLTRGE